MFVLEDLLLRPFVGIVDAIHAIALEELYDVEAIQDELKENQLLYELGERPQAEYEATKATLEEELEVAREARTRLSSGRIEVKR